MESFIRRLVVAGVYTALILGNLAYISPTTGFPWPLVILHQLGFMLCIWAHVACMLTDPGYIPLGCATKESEGTSPWCSKCSVPKPARAHHCKVCCRCVLRMDHHCHFMHNCVGLRNRKFFIQFCSYVVIHCTLSVFSVIGNMVVCRNMFMECRMREGCDEKQTCMYDIAYLALHVFGLVLALTSCSYAMHRLDDMHESISDNLSIIDRKQGKEAEPQHIFDGLHEIMGEHFSWRWFLPVHRPTSDRDALNVAIHGRPHLKAS